MRATGRGVAGFYFVPKCTGLRHRTEPPKFLGVSRPAVGKSRNTPADVKLDFGQIIYITSIVKLKKDSDVCMIRYITADVKLRKIQINARLDTSLQW